MTAAVSIYLFKLAFRQFGLKGALSVLILPLIMIALLIGLVL